MQTISVVCADASFVYTVSRVLLQHVLVLDCDARSGFVAKPELFVDMTIERATVDASYRMLPCDSLLMFLRCFENRLFVFLLRSEISVFVVRSVEQWGVRLLDASPTTSKPWLPIQRLNFQVDFAIVVDTVLCVCLCLQHIIEMRDIRRAVS